VAGARIGDTVGRYGGDEFVAILPDTDLPAAVVLAERLRSMISTAELSDRRVHLDASLGVSERHPGMSADDLVADADRAPLDAKRVGGGTVIASAGPAHDADGPRLAPDPIDIESARG
jgi:diguanylate cyclase (GGDEF)-like protein